MQRLLVIVSVAACALWLPSLAHAGRSKAVKLPSSGNISAYQLTIRAIGPNAARAKVPKLRVVASRVPATVTAVGAVKRDPKKKGRFIATVVVLNREAGGYRTLALDSFLAASAPAMTLWAPPQYDFTSAKTAADILYMNAQTPFAIEALGVVSRIVGVLPPGATAIEVIRVAGKLAADENAPEVGDWGFEYVSVEIRYFTPGGDEVVLVFEFLNIPNANLIVFQFAAGSVPSNYLPPQGAIGGIQGSQVGFARTSGVFSAGMEYAGNVRFSTLPPMGSDVIVTGSADLGRTFMDYKKRVRFEP